MRFNLEVRTKAKLDEYEKLQKSSFLEDYRKQIEEGRIGLLAAKLESMVMSCLSNRRDH